MFKLLVCVALASSGCIIHPVEKSTVKSLGIVASPTRYDANGTNVVTAKASSATLTIKAAHNRTCSRNIYDITEVRNWKEADLDAPDLGSGGGGGGGPLAAVYLFVFAGMAVTGIVSGTITAIDLAVSDDRIERRAKLRRVEHGHCSTALAGREIDVTLPSGAIVAGTTDTTGMLTLEIPQNEPGAGEVLVRIRSEAASTRVAYKRSPAHVASIE